MTTSKTGQVIDALRDDDIINQAGGRFKLTAMIQRRWLQIMQGERPMVETAGLTDMEVVIKEILDGKIEPVFNPDEQELQDEA